MLGIVDVRNMLSILCHQDILVLDVPNSCHNVRKENVGSSWECSTLWFLLVICSIRVLL